MLEVGRPFIHNDNVFSLFISFHGRLVKCLTDAASEHVTIPEDMCGRIPKVISLNYDVSKASAMMSNSPTPLFQIFGYAKQEDI